MGGGGRGDRPPPRLSQGLDDRPPTRVVFKLGSKVNCVCYGLATPHGDWLHSFFFYKNIFYKNIEAEICEF